MKEISDYQKVSLIFSIEEDGKKVNKDKWGIEIGKKYIIGRSKKKADISIEDISISRVQAEIIFYNSDKIMIKDYNSSNGTYINRQRIQPYKEQYFSTRDILSIGNDQNELIFDIQDDVTTINDNDNEERKIGYDFDEKKEINHYDINNYNNYYKNENKLNNKIKDRSKSFSRNSSYNNNKYNKKEKDEEYNREENRNDYNWGDGDEDNYIKYNREDKYNAYDEEDKYEREDKYNKKNKYDDEEVIFDEDDKYNNEEKFNKYNENNNNYNYEKYKKDDKDDNYKKYDKNDKKDKYIKYDRTNKEKRYTQNNNKDDYDKKRKKDNNKNKYKRKSRSRSRGSSYGDYKKKSSSNKYDKYNPKKKRKNWRYKRSYSSSNSEKKYGKNSGVKDNKKENSKNKKNNKYKNISSYIIKKDSVQEEVIEREINKRQIALYNEYLRTKRENEENNQKKNLPSLLPLLVSRPKEKENYSYEEDEEEDNDDDNEQEINELSYNRILNIRQLPRRIGIISDYGRSIFGIKRRRKLFPGILGRRL